MVPLPFSVSTSKRRECGDRPSMMWHVLTPCAMARTAHWTFGIMPPATMPSLMSFLTPLIDTCEEAPRAARLDHGPARTARPKEAGRRARARQTPHAAARWAGLSKGALQPCQSPRAPRE